MKPILVNPHWIGGTLWTLECYDYSRKWQSYSPDIEETVQRFTKEVLAEHVHSLGYKDSFCLKESLRYAIHTFTVDDWIKVFPQSFPLGCPKDFAVFMSIVWNELYKDGGLHLIDLAKYQRSDVIQKPSS
jgi:hypothetical protein